MVIDAWAFEEGLHIKRMDNTNLATPMGEDGKITHPGTSLMKACKANTTTFTFKQGPVGDQNASKP